MTYTKGDWVRCPHCNNIQGSIEIQYWVAIPYSDLEKERLEELCQRCKGRFNIIPDQKGNYEVLTEGSIIDYEVNCERDRLESIDQMKRVNQRSDIEHNSRPPLPSYIEAKNDLADFEYQQSGGYWSN